VNKDLDALEDAGKVFADTLERTFSSIFGGN